jgi:hypothetical protein
MCAVHLGVLDTLVPKRVLLKADLLDIDTSNHWKSEQPRYSLRYSFVYLACQR